MWELKKKIENNDNSNVVYETEGKTISKQYIIGTIIHVIVFLE